MQLNIPVTKDNVDEVIAVLQGSAAAVVELKKDALTSILIAWSNANVRSAGFQARLNWLDCLEQAGVDNWQGIDHAYDLKREYEGGDESPIE